MKPFYIILLILAALVATAASNRNQTSHATPDNGLRATDGAYRDGLFVGRLDRSHKQHHHVPSGRWSDATDRQSFIAGYEQGYFESAEN